MPSGNGEEKGRAVAELHHRTHDQDEMTFLMSAALWMERRLVLRVLR